MDVNGALVSLGSFGRWQVIQFAILGCATMFPAALHTIAIVYIGYKPQHRCKTPENALLNETIPYDGNKFSSCKIFVNYSQGNETMDCNNGWEYLGDDGPTIVTKWDLVCGKDFLAQTSQTVLVFGVMVGAVVFTTLSDRFGRKPLFMFSQIAMVVVGVVTAFNDSIHLFFALRFLTGALQQGILLTGFTMSCEFFAAKHRTFTGINVQVFWAVASSFYPLIAYIFKNWVNLQLFISLFGLLTIPLFRCLPESAMWLYANGESMKAEAIIIKAAKTNKVILPDVLLLHKSCPLSADKTKISKGLELFSCNRNIENREPVSVISSKYTYRDLFKSRRLLVHLGISSFLWIVVSLVYYGMILSTNEMAGNRYINAFLNSIVELPAYISSYFVLQRFGRRKSLIGYYILAGLPLFVTSLIPSQLENKIDLTPLFICLTVIGKFGISGAFGIVLLYVSELFPTNLRNQSLGICSFFGRIGNFFATFSSVVMERHPRISTFSLGMCSLVAALLVLPLPETHNKPLPETIEDIESWFDVSKRTLDHSVVIKVNTCEDVNNQDT